jgi:hypothetical protein
MKFNATDIVKMGGAALLTALIFIALKPSAQQFPLVFNGTSTSGAISWVKAQNYMQQWDVSSPLKADDSGRAKTLHAFSFDAKQLDTIINHNLNPNGTDSTADDVFIFFGQDSTFQNGQSRFVNVHLILVGGKYDSTVGKDTLMINVKKKNSAFASSVYDKADPCPPNCPKSF